MPTYFDPIMQEDTVLDENTIVYLVKIGDNKFSIKAISSGLEHLPSDPTTHAEQYWPIPAKSLIDHSSNKLLFEEDKLTNQPISKGQVIELFAVDPDKTEPKQFSDSVKRELTENWAREVLQDQFAHAGQNPHFFFYQPLFIHGHHGDNTAQQQ
ncbi:TPA: Dot/Icm T4SS effector RavN, partial [Legionella pneumophila]